MLRVITGRFHPSLESALVDQLHLAQVDDPFTPVVILVPSSTLLDRIRRLLSHERQSTLLNVHLLTFHQFALRLADELHGQNRPTNIRIVDDLFFEQLVRYLTRNRPSGLAPLQRIGHASGTWAALWSTIRDLKDAGVDPAAALQSVTEGYFGQDEPDRLQALFTLYAAVEEVGKALGVGTADDFTEALIPFVPSSPFLASLTHLFYYGFYDLTQVQLSLLEAVRATVPTTLLFPLEEDASYKFSQRFFDRHISPLFAGASVRATVSQSDVVVGVHPVTLSISSVIGAEEELASTCRRILDLVETNGYRFDEIGVVARTLDAYSGLLRDVFDRYCIPFVTTGSTPLIHEPLCKLLLQLASLPINDFYGTTVLDVITSPLYRSSELLDGNPHYRPEQWKAMVSALRITHGRDEWERVKQVSQSVLTLQEEGDEEVQGGALDVASEVAALCWQVIEELLTSCESVSTKATIREHVDTLEQLVSRHLFRQEEEGPEKKHPADTRFHSIWQVIDQTLDRLRMLGLLGEELSWEEFFELLQHALERAAVPISSVPNQGVVLLDAMAARGIPFRALFVIGLTEKHFPRYIREDPFLRDRHRVVLDSTLGFKIDEKLAGYDEETLLFTLLCQAATQRLYCSYQRADENGRVSVVSPYVEQGVRRLGQHDSPIETVPRRLTERVAHRPAIHKYLSPRELVRWMVLQGQDPALLIHAMGQDAELFGHAVTAVAAIEQDVPLLTSFDGQTGPLPSHWSRVMQRGVAPTPLERYARCPFQYFGTDVLHLEPVRLAMRKEPDALALGILLHSALRFAYESLVGMGWPAAPLPHDTVRRVAEESVVKAAVECEREHPPGHYLLWELAKERAVALVLATIAADQAAYAESPYQPVAFEQEATGTLSLVVEEHSIKLKIQGRLDRLDRHRDSGVLRIIDYKYKTSSAMKTEDRNLRQSAVRGYRLQPPFYAHLDLAGLGVVEGVQLLFVAPNWPKPIDRSMLTKRDWAGNAGALIQDTIERLVTGLKAGRFFILPGTYCQTCEYRAACRREHQLSWWRAYRSTESKDLRSLRTIKVQDE
ncbi:MAG: exodeoxyribonuclease V subunit gamma [Nitrospira sp.]|nr:exodeoxyribonuclease V subunit gamma [Nitrospira sp.]